MMMMSNGVKPCERTRCTVATVMIAVLLAIMVAPTVSFMPASHVGASRSVVTVASSSQRAAGDEPLPLINPAETAVLICKFQNDFATPGGKIYDTVKEVMEVTNMKENSIHFVDLARKAGCTIVHCPISLQPVSKVFGYILCCTTEACFSLVAIFHTPD